MALGKGKNRQAYSLWLDSGNADGGFGLMLAATPPSPGAPPKRHTAGQSLPQVTERGSYLPTYERDRRLTPKEITEDDWSEGIGVSYDYVENVCTRGPNVATPSGASVAASMTNFTSPCVGSVQIASDITFISGSKAGKIANATFSDGAAPSVVAVNDGTSWATGFTSQSIVRLGSKAYIGGSGAGMVSWDNTSMVQSTVTASLLGAVHWVPMGANFTSTLRGQGTWFLVAADSATTARWCASTVNVMTSANWNPTPSQPIGPGATLGSTSASTGAYTINSIVTSRHHAYFLTHGGVMDLDGNGYSPNLTPWAESMVSANNGLWGIISQQYLYASFVNGLARLDLASGDLQTEPVWCQPGIGTTSNGSPIYGTPVAGVLDQDWIVVAFYNGGSTYICYGKDRRHFHDRRSQGPGPLLWHGGEYFLTGERVSHMRIAFPSGAPKLFVWSYDTSTPTTQHLRMYDLALGQSFYNDYKQGSTNKFQATGTIYHLPQSFDDPLWRKHLIQGTFVSENLTDSTVAGTGPVSLGLNIKADQIGNYQNFGDSSANSTAYVSPLTSLIATTLSGTRVQLKTVLTSQATVPAVLRSVSMAARIGMPQAEHRTYTVEIGPDVLTYNKERAYRRAGFILERLWKLQEAGPIQMRTEFNDYAISWINGGMDIQYHELSRSQWVAYVSFTATLHFTEHFLDDDAKLDQLEIVT